VILVDSDEGAGREHVRIDSGAIVVGIEHGAARSDFF